MYTFIVLDDNKIAVSALVKMIENMKLPLNLVGIAMDGLSGLKLIYDQKPDIVITDIRMPGYDGLQMLQEMRENGLMCKCLIASGYGDFAYAKRALQLGASDFLLKPISARELQKALCSIVAALDIQYEKLSEQESEKNEKVYSAKMQTALKWIDQHIHESITQTAISEVLGVSSSHFSKMFKKEMGMGFSSYVTMRKMQEAQQLLKNPQNKVYEVADMLGYSDYAYFFQVFKKHFGFSPNDRRARRENN